MHVQHWLAAVVGVTATLSAQSFSYPNFNGTAGLNLLGNAVQNGDVLQLTANQAFEAGWAWRQIPVSVVAGFDTTFTFAITPGSNGYAAEGLAFVMHDDPAGAVAMGATGSAMGYAEAFGSSGGIRNSIAIEFDTFQTWLTGDLSDNEISIHTRGALGNNGFETFSIAHVTPPIDFSDGNVHTVRVAYVPGQLEVFLDDLVTPVLSRSYDFISGGQYWHGQPAPGTNMVAGTAFVGFSATSSGLILPTQMTEILSWHWTSGVLPDPCYAGSLGADTLTVDGSAGDLYRQVRVATWQPFGIELADPPAFGPGAPYVLFASFLPQPGVIGTALGFGATCFPVLPSGPTEFVLADSFGLLPAILPANPTPHTVAIPAGAVTSPLELTLQAVTLASALPLGLGVTNAVELSIRQPVAPRINAVLPWSAAVGQPITINGAGFVPGLAVTISGSPVTPSSISATEIVFAYPAGVGCASLLRVIHPSGQSDTSVINPVPVVTGFGVGPWGSAAGGQIFGVQGTGFAPGVTVTIGGAPAQITSVTPTAVGMYTPPGIPGVVPVVITTPGGCSTSTTYTYL